MRHNTPQRPDIAPRTAAVTGAKSSWNFMTVRTDEPPPATPTATCTTTRQSKAPHQVLAPRTAIWDGFFSVCVTENGQEKSAQANCRFDHMRVRRLEPNSVSDI